MMTIIIFVVLVLILAVVAWLVWPHLAPLVRDSETLLVARAMVAIGALLQIAELLTPEQMNAVLGWIGLGPQAPAIVAIIGVVVEFARRNRAIDV